MIVEDDRDPEQRSTHRWLVIMTDKFMSGWGGAAGGLSVCAWACRGPNEAATVERWVRARSDARNVRVTSDAPHRPYRPRANANKPIAHFHIYVVTEGHPALAA